MSKNIQKNWAGVVKGPESELFTKLPTWTKTKTMFERLTVCDCVRMIDDQTEFRLVPYQSEEKCNSNKNLV